VGAAAVNKTAACHARLPRLLGGGEGILLHLVIYHHGSVAAFVQHVTTGLEWLACLVPECPKKLLSNM